MKYFDKNVKHLKRFETEDWIYVDTPSVVEMWQAEKTSNDSPSVKLISKKMAPLKVTRTTEHTVAVDVDGLHNNKSIKCVSLVRTANQYGLQCGVVEDVIEDDNQQETNSDVGDKCWYNQHSCDPKTGTRGQHQKQDVDTKPQEYVVRKLVGRCVDSEGTMYRVRWYGYSINEAT